LHLLNASDDDRRRDLMAATLAARVIAQLKLRMNYLLLVNSVEN